MMMLSDFNIAGVRFRLQGPSRQWLAPLYARYAAFLDADNAPNRPVWQVTVEHDTGVTGEDAPWIVHDGASTRFGISRHRGWIDLAARRAAVSAPSAEWAVSAVERVLAYICMQALPREHSALLLHGTAVALGEHGLACCGHSGAGKTTLARLAQGHAAVLTDENLVISLAGVEPVLVSTPFWGASTPLELIQRVNRRVPLAALFLLEHAPSFELVRLGAGQAVMALLTTEKVAVERTASASAWLAVVDELVSRVPIFTLRFSPTPGLWPFLAVQLRELLHIN
jgi:hypothetical protein